MSSKPYRLNFVSSVNHGRLLVALFEGDTMRMAMLARPDFHMLIAGKYVIDPTPLTAAQVAAPPPNAHAPDTMPMMSGMPMPGGPPGAGPAGASGPASAPPAAAAPAGAGLTTASTYGALLANPKTKAVLAELAPEVVNNPQSQMGLDLAFKDLAQYEPSLTPDKLAQIDARLKQAQ
jgi:hypothetical protein